MEFSSNDTDNSATVKGNNVMNDFNPYKNYGAEHGMPEINSGYVDVNDINVQRKRRLPMPPASKPLPPRKNFELWSLHFNQLCSYCRDSRLILSITLSVLAVVALGVVIILVVTNIEEPEPSPPPITTTKVPDATCPCEVVYELISSKVLQCELKAIGNTTVSFDKESGENIRPIIYQTGIRIPDNIPERNSFSASWRSDGTLITRINFSPVQCHDEGNYSLTVTSGAGTFLHFIYVQVKDTPKTPTISISKGLFEDKDNQLQCQASTGCRKVNVTLEMTEENGQDYHTMPNSLTTKHYQEGYIYTTNVTMILTNHEVSSLHNKFVRCTYSVGGNKYDSVPIHMKVIPADFCKNKNLNCDYPHPYDCNKYITCTVIPLERTCLPGLHFLYSDSCNGPCVYPNEAKCSLGQ